MGGTPHDWTVPGYTEVRQLGAGAGGRVVLATHGESGTHVAIKYLSADLRGQPGFLARFREEAQLLVELEDPHVVQLYEYVQSERGDAAIVMELVEGVSLRALLGEHGATGPEAALTVLKGSLLGLSAAHAAGVVHRDYKPENVLVDAGGTSKIADFGIALRAGDTGSTAGTPPYMAPEQWAGYPASPQSDVYAATVVFFECLTGHRPYRATEQALLMHQHQTAPPPVEEVPEPLRDLLARGLAKDPMDRPEAAEPFVAELEEAAVAAYGPDWEERGRRRLAALAALLATLFPLRQSPSQASASVARTMLRPLRRNVRIVAGAGLVALAGGLVVFGLASYDRIAAGSPPAAVATLPGGTVPGSDGPSPSAQISPIVSPSASPEPGPSQASPIGFHPTPSAATSPLSTSPSASSSPSASPSGSASPSASASKKPSPLPSRTPSPSPSAPTKVTAVNLSGFALPPGDVPVARGTARVTTSGTGAVRLTVRFTVNGSVVATRTATLKGARRYDREFSAELGTRPCDGTVGMTASTSPASGNGVQSASTKVRPCPPKVTGLRVEALTMTERTRTGAAVLVVTTANAQAVELKVSFQLAGKSLHVASVRLSGKTGYTTTVSFRFPRPLCGLGWGVTATTVPEGPPASAARELSPCAASLPLPGAGNRAAGKY
ncbi:serine/threonine-protein kinase [Sphaerisporangium sp. NPDC088356]|uniref:serine/threonine-protein kinase n=1 Tax=Sphaerisporangium sp. NPDC088356 TaxID=3154871 RepID=UPI003438577E